MTGSLSLTRPIIFSAPMVRALLDGRKTQTRRLAWLRPDVGRAERAHFYSQWNKVTPRDLLWVREAWRTTTDFDGCSPSEIARKCLEAGYGGPWAPLKFDAGGPEQDFCEGELGDWSKRGRPSIHMPRWASRLTLEVTDVRIQKLQNLDDYDAVSEGVVFETADPPFYYVPYVDPHSLTAVEVWTGARECFGKLWNLLHDKPWRWEDNPDVVALTFKVHHCNVDELLKQREAA